MRGSPSSGILVLIHTASENCRLDVDLTLHEPLQGENFTQQRLLESILFGSQPRESRQRSHSTLIPLLAWPLTTLGLSPTHLILWVSVLPNAFFFFFFL